MGSQTSARSSLPSRRASKGLFVASMTSCTFHARKFLLKKKQAGRKPVIGGVALRGNAEQPRGAFCVLGRVAVFLNVRFRAIELRKHGASRLQEAVTG